MNREVSDSMSIENDPVFDIIIPLCSVCLNCGDRDECKAKEKKDRLCKLGKSYSCDKFIPNENDIFFNKIKDKIKDAE